jgi:hypothetical protein
MSKLDCLIQEIARHIPVDGRRASASASAAC